MGGKFGSVGRKYYLFHQEYGKFNTINFRMLLWITVIEFSEFPCQRVENLHREKKSHHHQRTLKSLGPILENGNLNKVSFEIKSKEVNPGAD